MFPATTWSAGAPQQQLQGMQTQSSTHCTAAPHTKALRRCFKAPRGTFEVLYLRMTDAQLGVCHCQQVERRTLAVSSAQKQLLQHPQTRRNQRQRCTNTPPGSLICMRTQLKDNNGQQGGEEGSVQADAQQEILQGNAQRTC